MMMKKLLTSIFLISMVFCNFTYIANASSISASEREVTMQPGESHEITFSIQPTHHEVGREMSYTPSTVGINVSNSQISVIEEEEIETEPWYSVSEWGSFDQGEVITGDAQGVQFMLAIDVPEDTPPGTYYLGAMFVIVPNVEDTAAGATSMMVVGRSVNRITINIEGDNVEENLELKSFTLDKAKYIQGDIVFLTEFENLSRTALAPHGTIALFDSQGNKVNQIVSVYEERADGNKILKSEQNEILVNLSNVAIEPLNSRSLETPWNNKTIALGDYTAKLEGYYGREGKIEAELDISITESINITDLIVSKSFSTGEKLQFNSDIQNIGNNAQAINLNFEIKNLFGKTIFSNNSTQEVNSATVEKYETSWTPSLGLGRYTASLTVGNITRDTVFIIIIWWQIVITLIALAIIIYLIVHVMRKYSSMKAKLNEKTQAQDENVNIK